MHQPAPRPDWTPGPVAPPRDAARRPTRVEPVPGTGYSLVIFGPPPATSGPAVGALVAGVASILVSLVVACFGLVDATGSTERGLGALIGGAFAVLTGFLGAAGIGLGLASLRQSRPYRQPAGGGVRGRGMAIAGIACGGVGITIAACALGVAALAAFS